MNTGFETEINSLIVYIFLGFILMSFVIVLFFFKSRKKIVQNELELKDLEINHQKQLLRAVIITQEEERERIAKDLHDDISSKLNIVSLNSHLLKTNDLSKDEISELTDNIINLTSKALDNSRAIAHNLLPPILYKFGLNAAIEELCSEVNKAKTSKINYTTNIDFNDCSSEKQLHIFRILQELINNSLKHSEAQNIYILFDKKEKVCVFEYSDDGVGFDIKEYKNNKGLGMKNIESRVSFINGVINISASKNKGIRVLIKY